MKFIDTPNLDKLHDAVEKMDLVLDFLSWYKFRSGAKLTQTDNHGFYEVPMQVVKEDLLNFFGVDMESVEKEKKEVQAYLNSIMGAVKHVGQ